MYNILLYTFSGILVTASISFFYSIWQFIFFIFFKKNTIKNIVFSFTGLSVIMITMWLLPYYISLFGVTMSHSDIWSAVIHIVHFLWDNIIP